MTGVLHLIECHCCLPQYKNSKKPVYHKFKVFSILDDGDTVISKHSQCNNCGVVHHVIDICKSEIIIPLFKLLFFKILIAVLLVLITCLNLNFFIIIK